MNKLISLLLALLMCLMLAMPVALAEAADAPPADAQENLDDGSAEDEWLYEEDDGADALDEDLADEELIAAELNGLDDGEAIDETVGETEQDILEGAMEVYSWFALEPLDVDEALADTTGTMWRVLDERFSTKDEMLDMLHFYFSDEIVDDLWNSSSNPYKEIDGYLYTNGEGRAMDERIGETEAVVASQTDSKVELTVTVHYMEPDEYGTTEETFNYVRELVGNEWKYTLFPFFW